MKISAIIITFNEEATIKECIDSLKAVADEIVVVDSFSRDKTKEICMHEGCRFVEHGFEGYGAQKNYANSLAHYDYILSLDADERLSKDLIQSILSIKDHPTMDAYSSNRRNNIGGKWVKHGGFYPNVKIRLWRKGAAQWSTRIVHEETVVNEGCTLGHLKGDLLHYAYPSLEAFKTTYWHYNTLKANTYFDKGKRMSYGSYLFRRSFKFIKSFLIQGGFRGGIHGFKVACILSATERALYEALKGKHQGLR